MAAPGPDSRRRTREPVVREEVGSRRRLFRAKILAFVVGFLFLGTSLLVLVEALTREPTGDAVLGLDSQPKLAPGDRVLDIVVFTSPACTGCRDFHLYGALSDVYGEFVYPGRANVYYKHAPAGEFEWEMEAAIAQECVHRQDGDAFWEFTGTIYREMGALTADGFRAFAMNETRDLEGVDAAAFAACLDDPDARAAVESDVAHAAEVGVTSLPSVVLVDGLGKMLRVPEPFTMDGLRQTAAKAGS